MSERYLITSAQAEARPNYKLLESMETYLAQNAGRLVILPMIGRDASQDWRSLHPTFDEYDVAYDTRKLNDGIQIEQFHVKPNQIDPVTGLQRFAQRERTQVFASPKQRMKAIPDTSRDHTKFLVTTGAVTFPNYSTGDDNSAERRRLGAIAKRDHEFGALVVETVGVKQYFMRHITSGNRGAFIDLGTMYDGKEITEGIRPEAMVLGDWHSGRSDPEVISTTLEALKTLKPKKIFLHDFFDGHSVSHHVEKQPITQQLLQQEDLGHTSLEQELTQCRDELIMLSELTDQVVVVMSNHHEFLNRWLDEGRFMKSPENMRFAFRLASYMAERDENDPVEFGIRMIGKIPRNIRFLKRTDSVKVRGYELGAHGDKGVGLGYGSITSKENDFGQSISAHVHTKQKQRNTHTVGTKLPRDMYYMRGSPSAWTNSDAIIWQDGSVQHIDYQNKLWRLQ